MPFGKGLCVRQNREKVVECYHVLRKVSYLIQGIRDRMDIRSLLHLKVDPAEDLLPGSAYYRSLDRSVEIYPSLFIPGEKVKTIALGKLVLTLEGTTQRLIGLRAHTPSSRWKVEGTEPLPEADAQGGVIFTHDFQGQDLRFYNLYPKYEYHQPDESLRIRLHGDYDLVIRVGDRILLGMDRTGVLTDIWLEGLRFTA